MYNLVQDDDGHWFVIPSDKEEEWQKYLYEVYELGEYPIESEWIKRVGGSPTLVKFPSYTIG